MEKLDISLLLVEDDKVIRNIYKQLLSKVITNIFIAVNGEDGYNKYLEHKPDLILSDIKMPVMNGLDMIKKIRINDKSQRIIIMSAYGESMFFLKAIDAGVKGFLVKPVDTDHLLNVIHEQANDILLEKRLIEEAIKRHIAERERDKGENILRALSKSTEAFFSHGFNDKTVNMSLKLIGEKTNVSRTYIFKINKSDSQTSISQIYEWVAPGIVPQINNDDLIDIPINDNLFSWWAVRMKKKKNIIGIIDDFEEPSKSVLLKQNILSLLAIPIFVNKNWWGFIGFDDCVLKRVWVNSEINALELLALNLGAAIYRSYAEQDMVNLNASLEEKVWERTKNLEQEVKERTIAESLLRNSEEKYRLIYENANDGIMIIIGSIIHLVNPKISEIIGTLPRNIIGKKFSSFVKPVYKEATIKYFDEQNNNTKGDLQVQILNGKWVEAKSTNIYWDVAYAKLVFISDITKRSIAENELHKLNSNLKKRIQEEITRVNAQQQLLVQKSKLESIGELSAGLAHEINQPLGGLSMGLENILFNTNSNGIDENYLRKKIDLLFNDINRIQKIIEHVRLFSRDQDSLIVEKISVNEVLTNALSLVSKQLTNHKVRLLVNIPHFPIYTLGNKYRLEQVILNMISNAQQAVDEKSAQLKTDDFVKEISIKLQENNSDIIITLRDNGSGIKKDIIPKIFNPFFTTKSEKRGTGLGLSISYGIISEMQGVINVESKEGEFTQVTILLPKK